MKTNTSIKAFEGRAKRVGFHDFKVADNGGYADVFLQHFYYGWEAAFDYQTSDTTDKYKCDGCRYCNPQEYIDRLEEWLGEEREELAEVKSRWQAEALELVSLQRPAGSMQRAWLQEEAAEIRREAEEEL